MSKHPIWLEATPRPGGVSLRVLGRASTAVEATFTLEVTAGSNRSVHRGMAALAENETASLATIDVSTGLAVGWQAVLNVTPAAAPPYEQIERAS